MFTSLFPALCGSSAVKCFIHSALKCMFYTYICMCEKLNRSAFINSAPDNLVAKASCHMESFMLFALNGSVLFPCMKEEKCLSTRKTREHEYSFLLQINTHICNLLPMTSHADVLPHSECLISRDDRMKQTVSSLALWV